MKHDKISISDRIKLIRKRFNLTQKELADRLNVGQSTIATVERTNNVSEQLLYILCKEFNIRKEWLKHGTGEMKKGPEEVIKEAVNNFSAEEAQEAIKNLYNELDNEGKILSFEEEKDKPEFLKVVDFLIKKYEEADQDMKGWLTVEIKRNFPEYEESVKKNQPEQKNA